MNKILTHAEYEARLKNITSPEEAAAFAQELLAQTLEDLKRPEAEDKTEIKIPAKPLKYRRKAIVAEIDTEIPKPWQDVVANDNEARVVDLYAKGMTTRDIAGYMKLHHGMDLSQPSISTITDKVYPLVKEWQARPLASAYPILYLDGLRFKVRESGKIAPKVAYIAMGINQYGEKEVLGIWTSETEGAKFWMLVLTDIKNRGVEDIFIACVDGLKGFPEAIKTVFPQAEVQVCIAHQIRHTIMFLPHKDRERFCADLKMVYTAHNEEAGMDALLKMMEKWPQYKSYLKSWENRWADLAPFFNYPEPIRRMIYTTNAIESLNHQFRKVTKTTTVFPHDDSLLKLLWLAQADIAQRWTMAVRNWGEAMAQLSILFPDRVQF
ncbi:MAG: IS256 family transposase [Candidatus Pacebacteria bacterium]|nr:IS256 family transposase [Candidatus Paceibacterota bacterium]